MLGVSACSGDDPEPKVAPSTAPTSPSTTAASDPIAPTMPPEAKGTDAAAAEAFVRFYWEMVNYAQETGDVDGLQGLARKCIGCDAAVKFVVESYSGGGRILGGTGRTGSFKTVFVKMHGGSWASVECRVKTDPQKVDRPGTSEDTTYPGGLTDVRLYLEPTDDAWLVRSLVTR